MNLALIYFIIFCILAIITAMSRGTKESMIMIQKDDYRYNLLADVDENSGVKRHDWFKYYKRIGLIKDLALFAFGYYFCLMDSTVPFQFYIIIAIIIWREYEAWYSFGRYGYHFKKDDLEHIDFIDIKKFRARVERWKMRLFRFTLIGGLLLWYLLSR